MHHVCVCMNAMASRLMSTVDEDVRVRGVGVHMGMGVGRMCVISVCCGVGSGVTAATLQLLLCLSVKNPDNGRAEIHCVLTKERETGYMEIQSDRQKR